MSFEIGLLLVIMSGIANGCFSLPMRLLNGWRWEQVWLSFMLVGCVVFPLLLTVATTPRLLSVIHRLPIFYVFGASLVGFFWGFGAILFGRSINRLGISLGNTLVLSISSCFGSLIPFFFSRVNPEHAGQPISTIVIPIAIQLLGIVACGLAGFRRERALQQTSIIETNEGIMAALLMVVGSGFLSALFNIGFSLCQPLVESAVGVGLSTFQATNLVWSIILPAGTIPSIVLCTMMITSCRSHNIPLGPVTTPFLLWITLMGGLWTVSIVLYGSAVSFLGQYGVSIGWALSLGVALLTANAAGIISGEWIDAPRGAKMPLFCGIVLLLLAITLMAAT